MVNQDCMATIGQVGNVDHGMSRWAKLVAGRWLGVAHRCAVRRWTHPLIAWRRRGAFAIGMAGQDALGKRLWATRQAFQVE